MLASDVAQELGLLAEGGGGHLDQLAGAGATVALAGAVLGTAATSPHVARSTTRGGERR